MKLDKIIIGALVVSIIMFLGSMVRLFEEGVEFREQLRVEQAHKQPAPKECK